MNLKLCSAAVAGLMGLAASADVLYWQVNNAEADKNSKSEYSYAMLKASTSADTSGAQYYVSENRTASGTTIGSTIDRSTFEDGGYVGGVMDASKILSADGKNTAYGAPGASLSGLYFFLELYDSSGNWVGQTNPAQAYDSLVSNGIVNSDFNPNFSGVNTALGSSGVGYTSVPEPTSGLLMLVGLGALALRRRRLA